MSKLDCFEIYVVNTIPCPINLNQFRHGLVMFRTYFEMIVEYKNFFQKFLSIPIPSAYVLVIDTFSLLII